MQVGDPPPLLIERGGEEEEGEEGGWFTGGWDIIEENWLEEGEGEEVDSKSEGSVGAWGGALDDLLP